MNMTDFIEVEIMGAERLVETIKGLNEELLGEHYLFADRKDLLPVIISDLDMSKLRYPPGYYYDERVGVTNKGYAWRGLYEAFLVFHRMS